MAYTRPYVLNNAPTGLAVNGLRVQIFDSTGTQYGSLITTGFREVGTGSYMVPITLPDGFVGAVHWYLAADSTRGFTWAVDPREGEYLDVPVSSRLPIGASVVYAGPVAPSGEIGLVRGDSYLTADGRQLRWTIIDDGTLDLTGATVTFTARSPDRRHTITKSGTVHTATGTEKVVWVELASSDTDIPPRVRGYSYDVQATKGGTDIITIARDKLTVLEDTTGA
jgi:hypothetical protein